MDLSRYLMRVLRWWWLILLSIGIAAGASYLASSQQPRIYQTTTTLIVGQVTQKANPTSQDFSTTEQLARSYAQMASRQPILQATVDSLGLEMNWRSLQGQLTVYPVEGTQLLGITVRDNSPERAVAIADEIARQLILQSPTSPENKARQERSQFVQDQLDDLEVRIQAAKARVEELRAELDTTFSARQLQDLQTEIDNLEALINEWQANYADLLKFFEGTNSTNYLSIIEPAQLPTVPISPKVKTNMLLAAATGLMLALGAASLLEYIDDTVKSTDDLSASLGLTALGSIDRINGNDYKDKLVTAHSPFSPLLEAYRLVRTNIQLMADDHPARSIIVTSPNPGEGKSLTAANLGVIMAQTGLRTIIVDADIRQPAMHKIFQVPNLGGLTDLLRSPEAELSDQLKDTAIENLQVITSGLLPPNYSEMLGSRRMTALLGRLEEMADVLIFDSPPVLAVTDALVLSNRVDGVILVTEAGRTRRKAIRQTIERLNRVGANILGAVLNQVSGKGGTYAPYSHYARGEPGGANRSGQTGQRRWWQRLPVLK